MYSKKEPDSWKNVLDELSKHACPPIDGALPVWPHQNKENVHWIGLHGENFAYTHHSSHGKRLDETRNENLLKDMRKPEKDDNNTFSKKAESLFCTPISESRRLQSIIDLSKGGSVLVTGYRGTGKSSLVNQAIADLIKKEKIETGNELANIRKEHLDELKTHNSEWVSKFNLKKDKWQTTQSTKDYPKVFSNYFFLLLYGLSIVTLLVFSWWYYAGRSRLIRGIDNYENYSHAPFWLAITLLGFYVLKITYEAYKRYRYDKTNDKPIIKFKRNSLTKLMDIIFPLLGAIYIFSMAIYYTVFLNYEPEHIFPVDDFTKWLFQPDVMLTLLFGITIMYGVRSNANYRIASIKPHKYSKIFNILQRLFSSKIDWIQIFKINLYGIVLLFACAVIFIGITENPDFPYYVHSIFGFAATINIIVLLSSRSHVFARSKYVPIRINLSTSRTAPALTEIMIRELHTQSRKHNLPGVNPKIVQRIYKRSRGFSKYANARNSKVGFSVGSPKDSSGILSKISGSVEQSVSKTEEYTEGPYTIHDAQQDIHEILRDAKNVGYKIIFIFDELDKLIPKRPDDVNKPYDQKLFEIQNIVSDLKFLLTEANAHQIFIAGKDVDDSWQEDQNKGAGLFESIFVQNIYLPSTLSPKLQATCGPNTWIEDALLCWLKAWVRLDHDIRFKVSTKSDEIAQNFANVYMANNREKLIEGVMENILKVVGIKRINWTYNTALLTIPHFSENEIKSILLRSVTMPDIDSEDWKKKSEKNEIHNSIRPKSENVSALSMIKPFMSYLTLYYNTYIKTPGSFGKNNSTIKLLFKQTSSLATQKKKNEYSHRPFSEYFIKYYEKKTPKNDTETDANVTEKPHLLIQPATERRCRRIRYVLQYLTFKGRGIPRKILREFYALIRCTDDFPKMDQDYWKERGKLKYAVYIPSPVRQKIKFFASIVARLEAHQDRFRSLDDKGCVSMFHILDYIMKFYQTGFSWSDIENASFMTEREELYPSRELVVMILELLEDVLIERVDRRSRNYMLIPRIKHDLAGLYQAFGPEQIELRFTKAELSNEIRELQKSLANISSANPDQRLESFRLQIRLGEIYELLGDIPEAKLAYNKALRWIRMDIERMIKVKEFEQCSIECVAVVSYVSTGIEVLQKLGYLYELGREFRKSMNYYQQAIQFHDFARKNMSPHYSQILGEPIEYKKKQSKHLSYMNVSSDNADSLNSEIKDLVIQAMVPGHEETQVLPFYDNARKDEPLEPHFNTLNTGFEPEGLPQIFNSMAIVLEKMWHRFTSNRYMLAALDYYRWSYDTYNLIDQMINMGEVMMRRRDIRMATRWYVYALRRICSFQKVDNLDKKTTQPLIQTTSRARLFDHLGDVVFATHGTAMLDKSNMGLLTKCSSIKASKTLVQKEFHKKMNQIRTNFAFTDIFDTRDEEYFYTQAAQYYAINSMPLRECDIYLKKLTVRQMKIIEIVKKLEWPDKTITTREQLETWIETSDNNENIGDLIRAWCSFWDGAQKLMYSLVDIRPFVRQNDGPDNVIDRRRFGKLSSRIGKLLVFIANSELDELLLGSNKDSNVDNPKRVVRNLWKDVYCQKYIDKKLCNLTEDYLFILNDLKFGENGDQQIREIYSRQEGILRELTCLEKANRKLERVFNALIYQDSFTWNDNICENRNIQPQSLLWRISSQEWRYLDEEKPNKFLLGTLYYLLKNISYEIMKYKFNKPLLLKLQGYTRKLKTLYRAEVAYLGAFTSLEDNIRDMDAALSGREIGVLYLEGIRILSKVRGEVYDNGYYCYTHLLEQFVALCVCDSGDSIEKVPFDKQLAMIYCLLHIAAKRYLVYSIDTFHAEEQHSRCSNHMAGLTQRALGDLMLIRAEAMRCANEQGKLENDEKPTLIGFTIKWPEIKTITDKQGEHIKDTEPKECLLQSSEAYQNALGHYLGEVEDYTKRYRFSNDAYLVHNNIMDRQMHFDICHAIRNRHWDPFASDFNKGMEGRMAATKLHEIQRLLAVSKFESYPRPSKLQNQLESIKKKLDLVTLMSPRASSLCIQKDSEKFIVCWPEDSGDGENRSRPSKEPEERYKDYIPLCYFFRSFDDGLSKSNLNEIKETW